MAHEVTDDDRTGKRELEVENGKAVDAEDDKEEDDATE